MYSNELEIYSPEIGPKLHLKGTDILQTTFVSLRNYSENSCYEHCLRNIENPMHHARNISLPIRKPCPFRWLPSYIYQGHP